MIINANAEININELNNLSNTDFKIDLTQNNLGISMNKNKDIYTKGFIIESDIGPINLQLNITSNDQINNIDFNNLDLILEAGYKVDDNMNVAVKYESDINLNKYHYLKGKLSSHTTLDNIKINLDTENIIYGTEEKNNMCINYFGNKINPSISLINNNNVDLKLGLIYKQIETIDEYGNKEEKSENKISLNLNSKI